MNDEPGPQRPTFKRRILDWLFPPQPYISLYRLESLPWMRDLVFSDMTFVLCWRDRLRVLVSGRVCARSVTAVSAEAERTDTETVVWVAPPECCDRDCRPPE